MPVRKDPYAISNQVESSDSLIETTIKQMVKDSQPTFVRMVILETIFDPYIIDDDKIDYWTHTLNVSNIRFAKSLPRNSVIAKKALMGYTNISQPMFLFPFFPSHLALPCKPGEMVWTMFENPDAKIKEIGYWVCRITEPHIADDVNHTHHARQLDPSMQFVNSKITGSNFPKQPFYELRNGKPNTDSDGKRYVNPSTIVIEDESENIFEKLITETDAAKLTQYEAVPRFRKRPGDVALEGSNNTLLVLGTDRRSNIASYTWNADRDHNPIVPTGPGDLEGKAGSIDIVAGRGYTNATFGSAVDTTKIFDGTFLKKELAKTKDKLSANEGDPDFINDRSRILIAQRAYIDAAFGLGDYNTLPIEDKHAEEDSSKYKFKNPTIEDSDSGDAGIVIKSDKIRIIARSDVQIIVTGFTPAVDGVSTSPKKDNQDISTWASITIKSSGDIVFSPSETGTIKLGGDDADRAILCTSEPATNDKGTVTAKPLATTAGGFVGTNGGANVDALAVAKITKPDLGTFASKILVKAY
jgi:hypothetical protein